VSYAVRFLFGNVPRLLSGAIFVAVSALCVMTSTAAQNAPATGSLPGHTPENEGMRVR
jgi:hypothetical protein